MIVVYIIVLILGLSVLVCLHELGHLCVAKICKVYCYEYSIGFGPAIVKHRFRHRTREEKRRYKEGSPLFRALVKGIDGTPGETEYCLRWIPLGGYVAMAGEDEEPEEIPVAAIPKERTLGGVNHFKQICIMLAGIAMNFLVAYLLFFVAYAAFDQTGYHYDSNAVTVSSDPEDPIAKAGLETGDEIVGLYQVYENLYTSEGDALVEELVFPSQENQKPIESYLSYKPGTDGSGGLDDIAEDCINYAGMNIVSNAYPVLVDGKEQTVVCKADSTRTLHLTYVEKGSEETKEVSVPLLAEEQENGSYAFEGFVLDPESYVFRLSPTEALEVSGRQFSSMFCEIYKALGSLFTPEGWKNVGGIVSIYRISTDAVTSGSGTYFFSLWAYISLNLGCFNLIPLPPLDGWNVLLALGETVTRKKIPSRVKGIAGTIGMAVLMILAILLIVKDVMVPMPI